MRLKELLLTKPQAFDRDLRNVEALYALPGQAPFTRRRCPIRPFTFLQRLSDPRMELAGDAYNYGSEFPQMTIADGSICHGLRDTPWDIGSCWHCASNDSPFKRCAWPSYAFWLHKQASRRHVSPKLRPTEKQIEHMLQI